MNAREVVASIVTVYLSIRASAWLYRKLRSLRIHSLAKSKRRSRDARKYELPYVSEAKKERILSLHAYQLAQAIKNNEFTCVEVMSTYIERALIIGRELELTTEEIFEQALNDAQRADDLLKISPETCGPLHGVPISIKDELPMRGCSNSGGATWTTKFTATQDANLVRLLRKAGAIPFVRSNLPQLLLWFECGNFVYGKSKNPWNTERTTGGSSGGEAGLICARASPLGVGSDIAGSIRIPCSHCGIYGFKPSPFRSSNKDAVRLNPYLKDSLHHIIHNSHGPMGRCVEDLILVLDAWWQPELFEDDSLVAPMKFNYDLYNDTYTRKNLRIGFYTDDSFFPSAPAMKRAVREVAEALKREGHTLIEFVPYRAGYGANLVVRSMMSCGVRNFIEQLQGEEEYWYYRPHVMKHYYPWISYIYNFFSNIGYPRYRYFWNAKQDISAYEACQLRCEIDEYRNAFMRKYHAMNLDAVICPGFGTVANKHDKSLSFSHAYSYTMIYNVLEVPVGSVPVSVVMPHECRYDADLNDWTSYKLNSDLATAVGMPVGIQVMSSSYEDEKVLGLMRQIQDIVGWNKFVR